jgi:hypothetical protein
MQKCHQSRKNLLRDPRLLLHYKIWKKTGASYPALVSSSTIMLDFVFCIKSNTMQCFRFAKILPKFNQKKFPATPSPYDFLFNVIFLKVKILKP